MNYFHSGFLFCTLTNHNQNCIVKPLSQPLMMKNLYFFCCCLFSTISYSQIPNGSFESWEIVDNYEVPTLWQTNQDSTIVRVSKDQDSADGEYAMKFSSNAGSAWFDCASRATLYHKFDEAIGENQSFFFYLKTISLQQNEDPFFSLFCRPFVDGVQQEAIEWFSTTEYTEYTQIEIPIFNSAIDSIELILASGALNGADDGCYSETEAWLDGFALSPSTTSNENVSKENINIYPNPSDQKFRISQEENEYQFYCIFNNLGQEVQSGKLENEEVILADQGIYFIHLFNRNEPNRKVTRKLIVSR